MADTQNQSQCLAETLTDSSATAREAKAEIQVERASNRLALKGQTFDPQLKELAIQQLAKNYEDEAIESCLDSSKPVKPVTPEPDKQCFKIAPGLNTTRNPYRRPDDLDCQPVAKKK